MAPLREQLCAWNIILLTLVCFLPALEQMSPHKPIYFFKERLTHAIAAPQLRFLILPRRHRADRSCRCPERSRGHGARGSAYLPRRFAPPLAADRLPPTSSREPETPGEASVSTLSNRVQAAPAR